jgi:Redoxin
MNNKTSCRRRGFVVLLAALLGGGPLAQAAGTAPESPSLGDRVPSFETQTVDGHTKSIDFPKGSATVLLFFLSGCPVCHKMIPEWNRAYERRPKGLRVIGVLMDQEPPGFFTATPIAFPVVRSPGIGFLRSLNVNRAPLTLRVGAGGVVEEAGVGVLDPIRLGEIFRP